MDRGDPAADLDGPVGHGGVTGPTDAAAAVAARRDADRVSGLLVDLAALDRAGTALAQVLTPGDVVFLIGEMGAGKSSLARALIQARLAAAGDWDDVPSPTYTLAQSYEAGDDRLLHADLYRLDGGEADALDAEVEELGLFDDDAAILLIEWPDRLGALSPPRRLEMRLSIPAGGGGRRLEAVGLGDGWAAALDALDRALDHG